MLREHLPTSWDIQIVDGEIHEVASSIVSVATIRVWKGSVRREQN